MTYSHNYPGLISTGDIKTFIESNPQYYYVYSLLGDYYFKSENYSKAIEFYNKAGKVELDQFHFHKVHF